MKKGFKRLLAEANDAIVTYTPAEAQALLGDESVVFVDVRDLPELKREGKIPRAVHASRGMLEFLVDPESPYHKPVFASDKKFLLYCASGGRSALAAQRLGRRSSTSWIMRTAHSTTLQLPVPRPLHSQHEPLFGPLPGPHPRQRCCPPPSLRSGSRPGGGR